MYTTRNKYLLFFQYSKKWKLFNLVKIETEKSRDRFYEDIPFKEGDIVHCSSRIKEIEGRKIYYLF